MCATYGCGSTFGLSDIQEELFFAPKTQPGALIWGVGPIFQFPTASPGVLGAGKWAVGPNIVGLIMPGHIVTGILVLQIWSFAGQVNRRNISSALIQPFFNYNLNGGWAISTAPIITANWTATQNKWAVPLGGGVAKTFKMDWRRIGLRFWDSAGFLEALSLTRDRSRVPRTRRPAGDQA